MLDSAQLKEIKQQLKAWRDERRITQEMQKANIVTLLNEEYEEFNQGFEKEDAHEMIDACCDMAVIILNAGAEYDTKVEISVNNLAAKVVDYKYSPQHLFNAAITKMEGLGFDPYLCMQETIKEISSRTGAYSEEVGKWLKDSDPKIQATWHKADYAKCKK